MKIVISGTPGTGKTTIAKALGERFNLRYVSVSDLVIREKLYTAYDHKTSSYLIDEESLMRRLDEEGGDVVIETIYPSLISRANLVVVLRRSPKQLLPDLQRRGWRIEKVLENVEAELVGVVAQEARESFPSDIICEIDTTDRTPASVLKDIEERECSDIDWLNTKEGLESAEEITRLKLRYNIP